MSPYWQYEIPLWCLFLVLLALLLIPLEIGVRLGDRRRRLVANSGSDEPSDVTLPAMLALLGLMLAFTYSFCMSRADLRKSALHTEVNAIGTAFLRANRLPDPGRSTLRKTLLEYARSRISKAGTVRTYEEAEAFIRKSLEVQARLWPALESALDQPGDVSAPEKALVIASMNDVLDAHVIRVAVFFDRLPMTVLLLLMLIAGASLGVAGYNCGVNGRSHRWRMTLFAVILAMLMYIILDFDMVQRGFVQIDHRSLYELIAEMEASLDA